MEITKNELANDKPSIKEKIYDALDSLFGPLVYLVTILLGIKTDYQKGETLLIMRDVGKEGTDTFIPAKSKVQFMEIAGAGLNPYVAVQYGDRVLAVKEVDLKIKSWLKRKKIAYNFNFKMMRGNKRLRKYHPFIIPRLIYIIGYFVADRMKDKK